MELEPQAETQHVTAEQIRLFPCSHALFITSSSLFICLNMAGFSLLFVLLL